VAAGAIKVTELNCRTSRMAARIVYSRS